MQDGKTVEEQTKEMLDKWPTIEPVDKMLVGNPPFRNGRRKLPNTRQSETHHFQVGMMDGYITVGLYEDGTPGEMFVTLAKEESTVRGLMDAVGVLTSYLLQYGVPLESLSHKMKGVAFEPYGITGNKDIPFTSSPVDYVFRWMENRFVNGKVKEVVGRTRQADGGEAQTNHNPPDAISLYERDPTWEKKRDEILANSMPLSERDNPDATPSVLARTPSTLCVDCGGFLFYEEGCMKCHSCGWSKC